MYGSELRYKMEATWRRKNFHCLVMSLFFFLIRLRPSSSGDHPRDARVSHGADWVSQ